MCARWREWAFRSGDEGEVGPRPVHVRLEGVSTFGQRMEGESFVTRESDSVPPRWMENFRLGDGPSGLCGLAGIRVSIEKEDGSSIGAGSRAAGGFVRADEGGGSSSACGEHSAAGAETMCRDGEEMECRCYRSR